MATLRHLRSAVSRRSENQIEPVLRALARDGFRAVDLSEDIETCLRAVGTKRYHMSIRNNVSRNSLSNANRTRDWRIYADFAQILIG